MKHLLEEVLNQIVKDMGTPQVTPVVEHPGDLTHGDYTTNVAMSLAKSLKRNPLDIAKEIVERVKGQGFRVKGKGLDHSTDSSGQISHLDGSKISVLQDIDKIEVVPPGFINFHMSTSALITSVISVLKEKEAYGMSQARKASSVQRLAPSKKKKIMVEFAHPNTHKAFHIGHLRNITTGESIIRLLESQGTEVIRVNYQGDVGMHIAKTLYGLLRIEEFRKMLKDFSSSEPQASREVSIKDSSRLRSNNKIVRERVDFLGKAYAAGSKAFEDDKKAQEDIKDINYLIYAAVQRFNKERGIEPSSTDYMKFVHGRAAEVDEVYKLWKETRQWSLDYFDSIYKRVGSHFERLYFESECLSGVDIAKEAVKKGILTESDGAVIFNGKPYGLDTRVFINSLGLPTYEGKELGLAQMEFSEFGYLDKLIHVLGPEQVSFTKVTFKVQELLGIQKNQQQHLTYGWVKLKHGKMSSRSGNVVLGEWLLDELKKEIYNILSKSVIKYSKTDQPDTVKDLGEAKEKIAETAAVAAAKYAFLKVGTNQEIAFDIKESVNINGDSGPYLQYTYARAKSVLRKAGVKYPLSGVEGLHKGKSSTGSDNKLNLEEMQVLRLIYRFPEVVEQAANTLSPSVLCTYLYKLASSFNTFYGAHSILGSVKGEGLSVKGHNSHNAPISPSYLKRGVGGVTDPTVTQFRLELTAATAQVLKNGLYLLGIETLEQM